MLQRRVCRALQLAQAHPLHLPARGPQRARLPLRRTDPVRDNSGRPRRHRAPPRTPGAAPAGHADRRQRCRGPQRQGI
ncbi:hypothetical protein FOCC_FOCC004395, partial [Frankliniella occidentalis]